MGPNCDWAQFLSDPIYWHVLFATGFIEPDEIVSLQDRGFRVEFETSLFDLLDDGLLVPPDMRHYPGGTQAGLFAKIDNNQLSTWTQGAVY